MKFLRNRQYPQSESNTITFVLLSEYQYTLYKLTITSLDMMGANTILYKVVKKCENYFNISPID